MRTADAIVAMADVADGRNNLKQLAALATSAPVSTGPVIPNNPLVLFRLVLLVYHLSQWFRVVSTVGSDGDQYEPLD